MKVKELTYQASAELSEKFSVFERHFIYPLGKTKQFRIDHGSDYNAFYRAIGNARTYYLEKDDRVVGTIGTAIKEVIFPGKGKVNLAYIGDLKIIRKYQGTRAILYLLNAIRSFLEAHADMAYCVVMDGTGVTPSQYTGRGGIPPFNPIAKRYILRFHTDSTQFSNYIHKINENEGWELFLRILSDVHLTKPAYYQLRSEITPSWISNQELAVGMLEDTRKAKRLYLDDDKEILSSHLSYFTFCNVDAGRNVILHALESSKKQYYPAMFLALNENQYEQLTPYLTDIKYEVATATIYCTDTLPEKFPINTSEI